MQNACDRDKGGTLKPGDIDSKTCELTSGSLENKHAEGQDANVENIPALDNCLDLIEVQATDDIVEEVENIYQEAQGHLESIRRH